MGVNNFITKITPLGSTTAYTVKDPIVQETIIGTQTSNTGTWTGKSNYINALYNGLTIKYYLPRNGSGNATLNLTLADNTTTTGAINCYYSGNTRLSTQYEAGNIILLTYFAAGAINITGTPTTDARWIAHADYNTNTDTKVTQTNTTATNDYRILLSGNANDTTETTGSNKNTNLRFNPGTQKLSVGGSISATGDLDDPIHVRSLFSPQSRMPDPSLNWKTSIPISVLKS